MRRLLIITVTILFLFGNLSIVVDSLLPNSEVLLNVAGTNIAPLGPKGPHGVIRINSNIEFDAMAATESWSGNGFITSPYIIEDYIIDANGTGNCIYIGNTTYYFIIRNCELSNASGSTSPIAYGAGITLNNLQYGRVEDNNLSNNEIGVYIYVSNFNIVHNNTCSSNNQTGIMLDGTSDYNTITNNTCENNSFSGIFINQSRFNTLENNVCNYNTNYGIYLYFSSRDTTIDRNKCNFNGDDGIRISSGCNDNFISNNTIARNDANGILISVTSSDNILNNNSCLSNNASGIYISTQISTNTLLRNNCSGNTQYGIYCYFSSQNDLERNICNNNQAGIWFEASTAQPSIQSVIINNTCSNNNGSGISLGTSEQNLVERNTCNQNNYSGILLQASRLNTVANNTFIFNNISGVVLSSAHQNRISNNNISGNKYGVEIDGGGTSAQYNMIFGNIISYNTDHGVILKQICNNNRFYHNNILFNAIQAAGSFTGTVFWDNDHNEGNFWSDYTGLDNGANDRTPGDGIGDTNIPHPSPGYDNYPFTNKDGWEVLSPPVLHDPGEINSTGNYTITWNSSMRALGYILEEDTDGSFTSPKQIYYGPNLSFEVTNKPDGEYYYHLKIYNDYLESWWSPSVDIYVDLAPSAPTGLIAKNITGHNVTLKWNLNTEDDIQEYYVFKNATGAGSEGPFVYVEQLHNSIFEYKVTELEEETLYYFVITATDLSLTHSPHSNVVPVTTLDETRPGVPKGLTAAAISDTEIELSWTKNIDVDLAGYLVYMNDTGQGPTGDFKLVNTISVGSSHINSTVVPNLTEQVTYYFKIQAFDEVPNKSPNSSVVSATPPDLTPPAIPTGLSVTDATDSSLTITWAANSDHDVVGYFVYRSFSPNGTYVERNLEIINETAYTDTGLNESTSYYYKVKAIDDANLSSLFSDYAFGTTISSQGPPELVQIIPETFFNEDSVLNNAFNLNDYFIDPNNDPLHFSYLGNVHIEITINDDGRVTLSSDENWNGEEIVTFYAFDGIYNTSDTVMITVMPVNDPPELPMIIEPLDGTIIKEGNLIDFKGSCSDPDLQGGDVLTFTWSSSISGTLGTGENLININLPFGDHEINLQVVDSYGQYSTASISITVQKEKDDSDDTDGKTDMPMSMGLFSYDIPVILILIIVIILIIVSFVITKSKGKEEEPPVPPEEKPSLEEEEGKEIEQPESAIPPQEAPYTETPPQPPPQEPPTTPTPPAPPPAVTEYAPEAPQEQVPPEPSTEVASTSTPPAHDMGVQTEPLQPQPQTLDTEPEQLETGQEPADTQEQEENSDITEE
jgi:parallel beta-helix repeat protein